MKSRILHTCLYLLLAGLAISSALASEEAPTIRISDPPIFSVTTGTATGVASGFSMSLTYDSPDLTPPASWRYLLVEARIDWPDGTHQWISSRYRFNVDGADLVAFDRPEWSAWQTWSDPAADEILVLSDLVQLNDDGEQVYYLLALQVMDADGTVSGDLVYHESVHNMYVSSTVGPVLTVQETASGMEETAFNINYMAYNTVDIGQLLTFEWSGSAALYGGTLEGYRWGWDLVDADDELDPGWAVGPGLSPSHMSAPPISFAEGEHALTVQCWDHVGNITRLTWVVEAVNNVGTLTQPEPTPDPPAGTQLHPCRPNPFNPSTLVAFDLKYAGPVSLRVVDARGRAVKTLFAGSLPAGPHDVRWNGRNDAGHSAPSGVYFAQLITERRRQMIQMTLLK